jgi:hypothetical protein
MRVAPEGCACSTQLVCPRQLRETLWLYSEVDTENRCFLYFFLSDFCQKVVAAARVTGR